MIKRIMLILVIVAFAAALVQAQGIKRVPNKKKDSTGTESVAPKQQQPPDQQKDVSRKPEFEKPKDEFIDRDGDGINDKINQPRPPAIKKQEPPKPRPQPPVKVKPAPVQPKEQPKEEPQKDTEKKKSKR